MAITPLSTQPNSVTRPATFGPDSDTYHAELANFIAELNATAGAVQVASSGGSVSVQFTFSTTTTDSDPGTGILRFNSATQNTSTVIRADLTGSDGSDQSALLALLANSTSANKGFLAIKHATLTTKYLTFSVASLASPSGYKNITVTCISSSGANPFADGDPVQFQFTPIADKGDTGPTGAPGNSHVGLQTCWVPVGGMTARLTNGAALGIVEMATTYNMFRTLDFDAATGEYAQFAIQMPKSWNKGTVTAAFVWSHAATTTNFGVTFGLQGVAISNDDAGAVAFGTGVLIADTGGTTNDIYVSSATAAITIDGTPAANDYVMFQVYRAVADAGDTMAIDARLHGIQLFYTTDAATDA